MNVLALVNSCAKVQKKYDLHKKNTEKLAYIIKKQYFCMEFRFNLKCKYIINL